MKSFLIFSSILMTCFMSFSQGNFTTTKCKAASNDRIRKQCIIEEIQKFVDSNYDITAIATDAKPGTNKIYTRFKIDASGKIADIQTKAASFPLEIEAIRVLESFPSLIPTTQNQSSQEDVFTLPIVFEIRKSVRDTVTEKITSN